MTVLDPLSRPYAYAAEEWREAGWSPLPLPARDKADPPAGYTGYHGIDADAQQVTAWIEARPDANIGLRMPRGVCGVDVDAYKPEGARSWATLCARNGPLPDTWMLTSRTDGVSGIRLFQLPADVKLRGAPEPGIEALQHHHRYAVAWPSIHPEGRLYQLIGPDGDVNCDLPHPDQLPQLPAAWVQDMAEQERPAGTAAPKRHTGDWSNAVHKVFGEANASMTKGSRHDTVRDAAAALARLEQQGHPGATDAIDSLGARFTHDIQDRATPPQATKEWDDILNGARKLVAATPSYRDDWDQLKPAETTRLTVASNPAVDGESFAEGELDQFLDVDLDAFLAGEEPPYDWIIPGIIEAGDRVIITGEEGKGKSTLLRQIAVQAATGTHPFTSEDMLAVRVLMIDCENSRRQVRRKIRPLRELVAERYIEGQLRINIVGHALDLAKPAVYADIALRVTAMRPHLILIGPLYKMTDGDPTKEEPAKALADALDNLRAICGSALIIEAHTPYAEGAKTKRPTRPYGASLWSRWPEFGLFLAPDGELEHWRGPRDEREWPRKLERATPWPWATTAVLAEPEPWDGPRHCMEAVADYLTQHPDLELSKRQLTDRLRALGLSYKDRTIAVAAERLAAEGTIKWRHGPRNGDLYSCGKPVENLAFSAEF